MAAHRLANTISCHAWNADRSMLAICPNTPELWIYTNCRDPDSANWERKWVLKQHDFVISGVDWCAATNRIVTASHDRNAFVWNFEPAAGGAANASAAGAGTWKPQVVVLNINRAALDVKWSPDGQKFAVSSGAKVVMICFFDPANDWWISKVSKKHKSTALTVAWHPSGQVLASVATDYRCRIISAHLEDVDGANPDAAAAVAAATTQFGALPEAGDVITEFETTRAWLNDCAWSPSGHCLAFVGHDSLLHVVTFAKEPTEAPTIQSIKCPTLPDMRALFLSDGALVTAGHAQNPEIFTRGADGFWRFACYADRKPEAGAAKAASSGSGGVAAARAMFASKVTKGQAAGSGPEDVWTKHQNAITYLKPYRAAPSGAITAFSTSGNDGKVVIWDLQALALPSLDLAAAGIA